MPVRAIVRFPDPVLSQPAEAIGTPDDATRALAQDLLDTMRAAPGVGITAPHVGVLVRLVVIELPGDAAPAFYCDPRVIAASTETARFTEGSVSMPGITDEVERPARVRVAFSDLDGTPREEEAQGFRAACLQHEIDQLDGVFWLRRLTRLRRERAMKRWEKARR
ncbi:peptide deformylase [Salinarimonas ramus]|uniref:Peptide deformylase-like n=1 Tax=Salinarimonas ramus TaxID=690164 RepID=A0A917V2P1_9HYPH|nr:peptide deformylase [Salinarimonas ramus]GGK24312.1 peptide deformylase-like protein [Salinarimonas ramus]